MLAVWPLFEQLLAFAVGTTDQALAGRFPDQDLRLRALDAIAIAAYLNWLLMIVQGAVGTGGLALVARATGAGDHRLARRALGQSLLLGTAVGLAVGLLAEATLPLLLGVFRMNPETEALATTFLRILALTGPFSGFIFAGNACLRGAGDMRSTFVIMSVVNLTNIALSSPFTLGPAPIGGHGVAGLAAGTSLAWVIGAGVLARRLLASRQELRLEWGHLRPERETLARIVRVSVPSAVEVLGMWCINAWLLRVVTALPQEAAPGAHMLALRAEGLSFLPGFAIGAASATLAGQYLGLGDRARAREAVGSAWIAGTLLMSGVGLLFLTIPGTLIALIVPDSPLHVRLAAPLLRLAGWTQPLLATTLILKTTFRGTGDAKAVMRYSYGSMILFRLFGAWAAGTCLAGGLFWIWVCMAADVATQAVVFSRRFFKGEWLKVKV